MRGLGLAREVLNEDGDPAAAAAAGDVTRRLPAPLFTEGLAATRDFPSWHYVAQCLGALALHLSETQREQALTDALAAEERLVARRAVLRQATHLWPGRLTSDQLNIVRRCPGRH